MRYEFNPEVKLLLVNHSNEKVRMVYMEDYMAHAKNRTETTILLLPKLRAELSNNLNNNRQKDFYTQCGSPFNISLRVRNYANFQFIHLN